MIKEKKAKYYNLISFRNKLLEVMPCWEACKTSRSSLWSFTIAKKKTDYKIILSFIENKLFICGQYPETKTKLKFKPTHPVIEVISANHSWKTIAKKIEEDFLPVYYSQYAYQKQKMRKFLKDVKQKKARLNTILAILERMPSSEANASLDAYGEVQNVPVYKNYVNNCDVLNDGNFSFYLEDVPFHIAVELAQFLKRKTR